jgi:hypothetical protein
MPRPLQERPHSSRGLVESLPACMERSDRGWGRTAGGGKQCVTWGELGLRGETGARRALWRRGPVACQRASRRRRRARSAARRRPAQGRRKRSLCRASGRAGVLSQRGGCSLRRGGGGALWPGRRGLRGAAAAHGAARTARRPRRRRASGRAGWGIRGSGPPQRWAPCAPGAGRVAAGGPGAAREVPRGGREGSPRARRARGGRRGGGELGSARSTKEWGRWGRAQPPLRKAAGAPPGAPPRGRGPPPAPGRPRQGMDSGGGAAAGGSGRGEAWRGSLGPAARPGGVGAPARAGGGGRGSGRGRPRPSAGQRAPQGKA